VEVPHTRRWLDLTDKGWAELIDKLDKVRLLADPTQGYAALAVAALNRQIDDLILGAPAATRAATARWWHCLPSQKIAVGGASLTLAKLLTTKEILDATKRTTTQPSPPTARAARPASSRSTRRC
jgi:hypothetical protein